MHLCLTKRLCDNAMETVQITLLRNLVSFNWNALVTTSKGVRQLNLFLHILQFSTMDASQHKLACSVVVKWLCMYETLFSSLVSVFVSLLLL